MSNPVTDPSEPAEPGVADPAASPDDVSSVEDEVVAELEESLEETEENDLFPYQAIVLTSFGGPEGPEEVMPFLRRVTGGRGIPDERLEEVAEHYYQFGGKSPINDQNRALIEAIRAELERRELPVPVLFGNRNSEPFLADAFREAAAEGMTRLLSITTSAYSCYSSCRQYREDIAAAQEELLAEGHEVHVDKVRQYWNHPGFSATNARIVTEAVRQRMEAGEGDADAGPGRAAPHLVFVTHSLPDSMDDTSGPGDEEGNLYSTQHTELAAAITAEVRATLGVEVEHDLTYCSRSGPPSQPWLEPDVNDHLRELASRGVRDVVLAPIGFVSDHMEVVFDLDTEAAETAQELGMDLLRVPTVGTDTEFVMGLVDLAMERATQAREEEVELPTWPGDAPRPAVCLPGCCPNLRQAKPAACGSD
ncbi:Ferrochelatase, protoheme ferro-lyase [Serinicoccus hydrothermalis]|uniref:Coproporphyrin III ferrochelatase n=1 Tax=Serinicoccus hydrothermalis TaxID=1758689 RepID=A0A1B1N998_9MICO|nr:ferrochelatase [Serinicoccus hydrothermalis]ANS77988.1 Ferrochelatase, protoheme ferro-lyase [Serinicoccus hydrothermalis]